MTENQPYYATQVGQVVEVQDSGSNIIYAKLVRIDFNLDGDIGPEVFIDGLEVILERDASNRLLLSFSNGQISDENDRHAWRGEGSLDFRFTDGTVPFGEPFSVPWRAPGKHGNGAPVPPYQISPINFDPPGSPIKQLMLAEKRVFFHLDEAH